MTSSSLLSSNSNTIIYILLSVIFHRGVGKTSFLTGAMSQLLAKKNHYTFTIICILENSSKKKFHLIKNVKCNFERKARIDHRELRGGEEEVSDQVLRENDLYNTFSIHYLYCLQ